MKCVVFDGNSIINRAFYGIRPLTNKEGLHTNGIFGFFNILLKFIEEEKPDLMCIAFDLKAKTFRHEKYEQYKAHRKGMPEELAEQMPVLKELLDAMKIKRLEVEGFEADDIIGTIASRCKKDNIECIIATGDKDDLQLVGDGVIVKLASTKNGKPETTVYDEKAIAETYGVKPEQLIEVKALMGDSSDNIPGVAGIGEKTAFTLIKEFSTLENLYKNIGSPTIKDTLREKLINDKEMAFLSHNLATICCDVPINEELKSFVLGEYEKDNLFVLLKKLEFHSFITRLGLTETSVEPSFITNEIIVKEESAENIANLANKSENLFFIFDEKENCIYFHFENEIAKTSLTSETYLALKEAMQNESIKKYTHNVKPFASKLLEKFISIKGLEFDTELAAYLLNPSASTYHTDRLSEEFAGATSKNAEEYCYYLPQICKNMKNKLAEFHQLELYYQIELPLSLVLSSMEHYGFKVDKTALEEYGKILDTKIELAKQNIYSLAQCEFNINSPKQLGEVLFEKLNLPSFKKTKTGYSTDAEVLEKLSGTHEIIDFLSEYRQLAKLKSTYIEGLLKVIADDGRIHSSFRQTVAQTGRISSTEPNLQNIPVRTEMGKELRRMFVAEDGFVLLDADYSQIELRVLAHIANDKKMIEAFINNEDIHRQTASEILDIPPEMVTPLMRNRAKAVNFGIVYGIGDYSLSQDLKISRKEARHYIDGYLETYYGVRKYMDETKIKATEDGFVTTLFGRRRYIPELKVANKVMKAFGERIALNTPIQGTAADIIKIAMVKVYNRLRDENLKSRLVLQVHDELLVEAAFDEISKVKVILQEEMQNAAKLNVPLIAEVGEGKTWYDAKS
jgi:DNA polymerase-1